LSKQKATIFILKTRYANSFVVNFYNAGVVTRDRWIGSRSQFYDFGIYNYNVGVVVS
jgi:hypothetical protein